MLKPIGHEKSYSRRVLIEQVYFPVTGVICENQFRVRTSELWRGMGGLTMSKFVPIFSDLISPLGGQLV